VVCFLTHLTERRQVSPASNRQPLSALLFPYKEVLSRDLAWMKEISRPPERRRIPAVLTVSAVQQVQQVLERMAGVTGLLARLLYGSGMRMAEALALRVNCG
jgi:integrase